MERITLPAYSVIGREGCTDDGAGIIQTLWATANERFAEIATMASQPLTLWGAMGAPDGSLQPWQDGFTKGRYLAGIQVPGDAVPPADWTKWDFPAYEAIVLPMTETAFGEGLKLLEREGLTLALAVQERTDPSKGETLLVFPIKLL